jgi:uncharacterized protein (DUF2236 family)
MATTVETEPRRETQSSESETTTPTLINEKGTVHAITKEEFLSPDFQPEEIRKIIQEGIIIAGGGAAILLQVAEPGVGAGVNEHSNFSYRVLDRLRTTMTYVYCMSYGTPQEKRTIVELVNRAHTAVNGKLNEGSSKGKAYNAFDPELQLWVAATLYACAIDIYQRIYGKFNDPKLEDTIYRQYSILAMSLQVPPEMWPKSRADFKVYWDNKIATLEVTQHARDVAQELLSLRRAPFHLRMAMPLVRLGTSYWLPDRMAQEFGLKRSPGRERAYNFCEGMVRTIYPRVPKKLRTWPLNHYLKDMRKRMKSMDHIIGKTA